MEFISKIAQYQFASEVKTIRFKITGHSWHSVFLALYVLVITHFVNSEVEVGLNEELCERKKIVYLFIKL